MHQRWIQMMAQHKLAENNRFIFPYIRFILINAKNI